MRVLAFGAHPDDIEFRMAGTLAKYAARGDEVYMCVATNGEIGSYGMSRAEIAELRHKEAQAAADVIGAKLIWLGYEDEMLFDNRETRMAFIEAIRMARPDVILAPPKGNKDYNQDHDICGYLAFECRVLATVKLMETEHPVIDHLPPLFYCTALGGLSDKTNPQYFVDVTDTFDTKMKMFACHASQQGDWCRDAFGVSYADMIVNENKFYASACGTAGVSYVEAFTLATDWPIIAGAHKLLP
ncbi:MAG: PIG-L family deacetylase [Ruminococcaceae bacterium]|nr:PIG-L family deacetylase [Oscillospiraceae bacterium]